MSCTNCESLAKQMNDEVRRRLNQEGATAEAWKQFQNEHEGLKSENERMRQALVAAQKAVNLALQGNLNISALIACRGLIEKALKVSA